MTDTKDCRTSEAGFSLIELMITVLIVGILIAIGLPIFLGARTRAQDRAAQEDLRTGLAAGLAYYAEKRDWTLFDDVQASREEPNIAWVDGGAPVVGQTSIHIHADQDLLLVRQSASGTYFCIAQVATSPATARGQGAAFTDVDQMAECTGGW
jgi:type IV pilus assembly protein PilA